MSLQANYAYRIMLAKWIDSSQEEFTAMLEFTGIDNMGLVNEVTKIISNNMHVNIRNISFETNDGIFTGRIMVIGKNNTILKTITYI